MQARRKFAIAAAVMAGIYTAATLLETAVPAIDLPLVPDLSINGREVPPIRGGELIPAEHLMVELMRAFPGLRADQIQLADRVFQAPRHEDLERLIRFMADFYWESPALRYTPEAYDCDNFARTFATVADLAKTEGWVGQIAVLRIYAHQARAWGGVPAGGQHALVVFRSDRGLYVHEPQGRTMVAAARYPNRTTLYQVKGD